MNQPVCKTNYVYVEMILKKSSQTYDVVAGLFKGIYEDKKKGGVFILLAGLKDATDCLNLEFYSIMTIEELEEDYRNMKYVLDTEDDQAKALEVLKNLKQKLIESGAGSESDQDIIDETKYTQIPDDYRKGEPIGAKFDQAGTGNYASATTRYEKTTYNSYNKTVIKKDPEPTAFERKEGELPSAEFLEALSARINAEEALELPDIMGPDEAGTGFDDDECYGNIYGHMCG